MNRVYNAAKGAVTNLTRSLALELGPKGVRVNAVNPSLTFTDLTQDTRIVLAHRLSTIRNADRIYVLQNGQLVQQGNFLQLSHQPGLFSQLTRRQQL